MRQLKVVGALILGLAGIANASSIFIAPNVDAPLFTVWNITSFTTDGAAMATLGMTVVVHFSNATDSGNTTWVTNVGACTSGIGCGQASGAVPGGGTWTLSETGNTGSVTDITNPNGSAVNPWTLTNTSTVTGITSVDILPGNSIIFDRNNNTNGQIGTPGSNFGIDYTFASESGANSPFVVNVTYKNLVNLSSPVQACQGFGTDTAAGCGDEFHNLSFAFNVGVGGGGPFIATGAGPAIWRFYQDTDTVGVPEPVTAGFVGFGLLGLFALRRRLLSRARY